MIDWNKRNGGFLSPESVYEDQLGNLSEQINEKDKEIDRLNNIINELEKYFEDYLKEYDNDDYNSYTAWKSKLDFCKYILDKLKELKEGK